MAKIIDRIMRAGEGKILRDLAKVRRGQGDRASGDAGGGSGGTGRSLWPPESRQWPGAGRRRDDLLLCPVGKELDRRSRWRGVGSVPDQRRQHGLWRQPRFRRAGIRQRRRWRVLCAADGGPRPLLLLLSMPVPDRPFTVLVLCTGNSARSILGEALFNHLGRGRVRAFSAGSKPKGVPHPGALRLLARRGIDTAAFRSKSWDEFTAAGAPP